ncbi:hypothetical protein [Spirillospora albida]|uniref:hypothetical protein n=1 Tax=Spirillospora albida TaxID=58123 RepID=UPI0012FC3F3F|nr:hypothetical protein [Spirillospora albida]
MLPTGLCSTSPGPAVPCATIRGCASLPTHRELGPFGPKSLLERLPASVTSAKHRTEVLKTIKRMRAALPPGDASPPRR